MGVKRTATAQTIRAAYLALMKRHHPDRTDVPAGKEDIRAKLINEAFATLKDSERRLRYDRELAKQTASRTSSPPRRSGPREVAVQKPRSTMPVRIIRERPSPRSSVGRNAVLAGVIFIPAFFAFSIVYEHLPGNAAPIASRAAEATSSAAESLGDQPVVLAAVVSDSIADFAWIKSNGTPEDAMRYSRNCFAQVGESHSFRLVDWCVAFDLAWGTEIARRPTARNAARAFFSVDEIKARHRLNLGQLSSDSAANEARLAILRRLTTSEIAHRMQPAPEAARSAPRDDFRR